MKKIVLLCVLLFTLTGCSDDHRMWEADILYRPTNLKFDNVKIKVKDGYVLNKGHQYDVVETESGYDLVLHFVEDGE